MVKYSYVIKGCVKLYDDSSHAHIKLSHWCYSNGYVIGKLFSKDIRQYGSGNTGATNSFRVLGKPAGFIVTFLDIFKGFITVFFLFGFQCMQMDRLARSSHGLIVGLFAILGHVYPIYLRFKGGKAVATSAGVVLGVNPILLLILAIIFFGVLYILNMFHSQVLLQQFVALLALSSYKITYYLG